MRNNNSIEHMRSRSSWRDYDQKPLSQKLKNEIDSFLDTFKTGPLGTKMRFIRVQQQDTSGAVKMGTYGVIKGASHFIAGAVEKCGAAELDFGYIMEKIILKMTALDLGTCWLAGTFSRSAFSRIIRLKEKEILPCVSPVGYKKESRSARDKIIRSMAGSKKRKPWEAVFFRENLNTPLSRKDAGKWEQPLEMVRIAPSSSNKQPWRIIQCEKDFHFFCAHSKSYQKMYKNFNVQMIDMGIAMCHFELAAENNGLKGQWLLNQEPEWPAQHENIKYVITYSVC